MNHEDLRRALARVAHEILGAEPRHRRPGHGWNLHQGGSASPPTGREYLEEFEGSPVPVAALDISLYRDDIQDRSRPVVRPTNIPVGIHDKKGGVG